MWPEEAQSLGLSIVGGRHIIKRLKNGEELKGIFIKQVLPNSPTAKTHSLKTGDKILQVGLGLIPAVPHTGSVPTIQWFHLQLQPADVDLGLNEKFWSEQQLPPQPVQLRSQQLVSGSAAIHFEICGPAQSDHRRLVLIHLLGRISS